MKSKLLNRPFPLLLTTDEKNQRSVFLIQRETDLWLALRTLFLRFEGLEYYAELAAPFSEDIPDVPTVIPAGFEKAYAEMARARDLAIEQQLQHGRDSAEFNAAKRALASPSPGFVELRRLYLFMRSRMVGEYEGFTIQSPDEFDMDGMPMDFYLGD